MTPQLRQGNATDAAVCDFCTVSPPVQSFACRPFIRRVPGPMPLAIRYLGGWAACATCAPLVLSRSWHALATRVVRLTGVPHAEVAGLFTQLARHLTGSTVPFQRHR